MYLCTQLLKRNSWPFDCISAIACVRSAIPLFMSSIDQPLAADIPGTAVFYAFSSQNPNRLSLQPDEKWDLFVRGLYTFIWYLC